MLFAVKSEKAHSHNKGGQAREEYSSYVGFDAHEDTVVVAVAYPGREKA
jgi:hypothetical protein